MEEKLNLLYKRCLDELKSIGIISDEKIALIRISLSNSRSKKMYGCCITSNPDVSSRYIEKRGKRKYIKYGKYGFYNIMINKWAMSLNDDIIKNTIMHELVHTLPYANNHGTEFKKYSAYINEKLGYNVSRLGNKKEDFIKSNLEYDDKKEENYKYNIICVKCGTEYKRKRISKDFFKKYRCSKCLGKLKMVDNLNR